MTRRIDHRTDLRAPTTYPPFAPLQLPGVQLWLRADTGSVSSWTDQSGNGNNAVQATGGNQPTIIASATLGGQSAYRFNGTTSFMNLTSVLSVGGNHSPASIAAVIVSQSQAATGSIISLNGFRLLNCISAASWAYYTAQSDNGIISVLSTATPYSLIAVQPAINSIGTTTFTNGVLFNSTSTNSTVTDSPCTVGANTGGANQFGQVDIAEIVVANVAWSPEQVFRLRSYFNTRYNFNA